MKKILVTGGAGFIGSHLTDWLVEEGYKVVVADDLSRGRLENVNTKADFEKIDITSKKFKNLVKKFKPDVIYHFAAQSNIGKSLEDPQKDISINFLATQSLLEQVKVLKVKKIIFASSAAVYAGSKKMPIEEEDPKEPISLYGVSKLLSEFLLRNYHKIHDLSYVSLRFANVYGPRQDMGAEGGVVAILIDKILKKDKAIIFGDGTQTRDFIYVSDVVDACLLSLKDNVIGEFNIGTANETSILGLYERLLELSGARDNRLPQPKGSDSLFFAQNSHNSQFENRGFFTQNIKFAKRRFLEVGRNSLSFKKYKNTTRWKPKVSIREGLKKTFDHFQKIQ